MKLMATLRSATACRRLSGTGNPGGPGHGWVKKRYIDPARGGWKVITEDFKNPFTGEVTQRERVFIPGRSPTTTCSAPAIRRQPADVRLARARTRLAGGRLGCDRRRLLPGVLRGRHVLADFHPPKHWRRFTADGLGLGAPVLDRLVCDRAGGDARADRDRAGTTLLPGALVCYREWYGEDPEQPSQNLGLKLPVEDWAKGVLERSQRRGDRLPHGGLPRCSTRTAGQPCRARDEGQGQGRALTLRRADKRRLPGWNQVRYRLRGDHGPSIRRRCCSSRAAARMRAHARRASAQRHRVEVRGRGLGRRGPRAGRASIWLHEPASKDAGPILRAARAEIVNGRRILNADELYELKNARPRLENVVSLPGDSRSASRVYYFSIDGVLRGEAVGGCLFAGECMIVQERTEPRAVRLAKEGLAETIRLLREEYERSASVLDLDPINAGLASDVAGRKAKPGGDLRTDQKLKAMIAHIIGGEPWKH
jgi:hypothetical protein